jgi:hypothetical protein
MNRLPEGLCIGIGCCHIDITVTLRSFTLNISHTGQSTRLLEQVNAFIIYNYNQYDGYSPFWFRPSDLEYDLTVPGYPAELAWAIPYQPNCKLAMEDRSNYACVSSHSQCLESLIGGYVCSCGEGFSGSPYIVNGCVLQESNQPPPASSHGRRRFLLSYFSLTTPRSLFVLFLSPNKFIIKYFLELI